MKLFYENSLRLKSLLRKAPSGNVFIFSYYFIYIFDYNVVIKAHSYPERKYEFKNSRKIKR